MPSGLGWGFWEVELTLAVLSFPQVVQLPDPHWG